MTKWYSIRSSEMKKGIYPHMVHIKIIYLPIQPLNIQSRGVFHLVLLRWKKDSIQEEGVRMDVMDYTNRNICTTDVFNKHIEEEIQRVKNLTGEVISMWLSNDIPVGGCGKTTRFQKSKEQGGRRVRHLFLQVSLQLTLCQYTKLHIGNKTCLKK